SNVSGIGPLFSLSVCECLQDLFYPAALSPLATALGRDDARERVGRAVAVVVDDHVVELSVAGDLAAGARESGGEVGLVDVPLGGAARPEPLLERLERR